MIILREITVYVAYRIHNDNLDQQISGTSLLGICYPDFDWMKMVKLENWCQSKNIHIFPVKDFCIWMAAPLESM